MVWRAKPGPAHAAATWSLPVTSVCTKLGAWTFGRLMSDMATPAGISPSDFVRNWLRSWQLDQVINSDGVPNRNTAILSSVINAWQTASGGPNAPLDVSIAPFRLLAIVNRVDLRGNTLYGGGVPKNPCDPACIGGESRFVFCVVNPATCTELPFTVILEYCNPPTTCSGIKAWAKQWADLNLLNFSPGFNAALQVITDQFAGLAKNPSQMPNQSFLNQLRSNEILNSPWQCLQWELSGAGSDAGHLRQSTVNQTPDIAHQNTMFLQSFVTDNLAAAAAGKHTIPLLYGPAGQQKLPFLGATAPMSSPGFFWNFPGSTASTTTKAARHHISLNSCNGCHAGETGTPFLHVSCRSPGFPAPLSQFLTGVANFPDPVDNSITYTYADLERRVQDLDCVVNSPCLFQIGFKVLSKFSVH